MPLPWSGQEPPFGFSPPGVATEPWLPQPKEWRELTVQAESGSPGSMLELYRCALRIRRAEPMLGDGPIRWLPSPDGVLMFDRTSGGPGSGEPESGEPASGDRGAGVRCVTNVSGGAVGLPPHAAIMLASGPLTDGLLPPDTTVWLPNEFLADQRRLRRAGTMAVQIGRA